MSRSKWAKKMDRVWEAKKPGKRTTAWGTVYYENRPNHSDINKLEENNNDMFLQLAEDNTAENYTPIQTNEGVFMVRNDLMSEDVTLSQKGKFKALVKKAAPIVGKVAGTALQFAPIPGAGIAGKILTNPKTLAALKKAGPALKKLKPIAQKIKGMPAAAAAIPAAVVAAEAANVAGEAGGSAGRAAVGDTEGAARQAEMEQAQGGKFGAFVKKYKLPLIIGGGVLLAGGIYLATRKKR
jgi:hypothetical protein